MTISDPLYSSQIIDDPLALELIHSSAFVRLKGIDLAGWYDPYISGARRVSRYEHSLGVYLLLLKFRASREESIAGLLHDISHSAFSHCIDYILDEGSPSTHSHQDSYHNEYIATTDIPSIIKKYGLNMTSLLDDSQHLLKERLIPDLCADRIDYSLRVAVAYNEITQKIAQKLISSLSIKKNIWVFDTYEHARQFAEIFNIMNKKHYSGFTSAVMFYTVGALMKHALAKNYITHSDLYTTDHEVIEKIQSYLPIDPMLSLLWSRMNAKLPVMNNPDHYIAAVHVKSRIVDPFFIDKDTIKKVSEHDLSWKRVVKKELIPKTYYLSF